MTPVAPARRPPVAAAARARRRNRLLMATAVIVVLVAAGVLLFRQIPEEVSAPLFIIVVIIEVVIAPIPGGAIGYMGAARFGFWQAWPMLYAGNIIGTAIVFMLARRLGTPIFEENVSTRNRARYDALLKRNPILLWFVYAIPILPLDILSALAGLSTIRARRFFTIAFSAFIVYTGIVAYVGAFLSELVGMTEALSILGMLFMVGLATWLWRQQRTRARRLHRVAVTGNIASGKTAVTDAWRELGAIVIDADELAREVVAPGTPALAEVVDRFGPGMLRADGELDRAALRHEVFSSDANRADLEAIIHPRIEQLRREREEAAAGAGARLIVHSIPLLFETGLQGGFDTIVLVDAPAAVRRARLVDSRGLDPAEADAMIEAQMEPASKRERADHVIDNVGTVEELTEQARRVWANLQQGVR